MPRVLQPYFFHPAKSLAAQMFFLAYYRRCFSFAAPAFLKAMQPSQF
jgi:hypothetical protein